MLFYTRNITFFVSAVNATSKPGSGLVNQGNVSVVAGAQSCFSFLPTSGGMARLSLPRAIVCKFPAHINYSVTRKSATRLELGTVMLRIQQRYHSFLHLYLLLFLSSKVSSNNKFQRVANFYLKAGPLRFIIMHLSGMFSIM